MFSRHTALLSLVSLLLPGGLVHAQDRTNANLDPACDQDNDGSTDDFDPDLTSPKAQEWALANGTGLSMTSSPLNIPAPYKPFQVVVGLELNQFDSMTCQERTVFLGTTQKSEDTNKTPIIPRPRVTLGLPYSAISISGLPPLKLFGVRTGVFSIEASGALPMKSSGLRPGARVHLSGGQIVGDIAHPIGLSHDDPAYEEEAVDDEYQFINTGADLSLAVEREVGGLQVAPYLGAGVLGVSSIFFVGEDAYTTFTGDYFLKYQHEENPTSLLPGYIGPDAFIGARAAAKDHLEGTLELLFIPVRMGLTDELATDSGEKSAYVTNYWSLRARFAWMF